MRKFRTLTMTVLLAMAAPALAEVKVNFVNPDHYRDANLHVEYGKSAKETTMREIERYFWALGDAYLAPDEKLTIDVLDIDLAGRFEPWQFNYKNVRFMRDFTWPAFRIRYRLESPSRAPLEGEETVADRYYLRDAFLGSYIDSMAYEKIMLQRWFRQRFVP